MSCKITSELRITITLLTGLVLFLIFYCVSTHLFPEYYFIMFAGLKYISKMLGMVLYALIVVSLIAITTSIIEISSSGMFKRMGRK